MGSQTILCLTSCPFSGLTSLGAPWGEGCASHPRQAGCLGSLRGCQPQPSPSLVAPAARERLGTQPEAFGCQQGGRAEALPSLSASCALLSGFLLPPDSDLPDTEHVAPFFSPRRQEQFQTNPDSYNGAVRENYAWSQDFSDLEIKVPVPKHVVKGKQVKWC